MQEIEDIKNCIRFLHKTIEDISLETEIDLKTVKKILDELVKNGEVEKISKDNKIYYKLKYDYKIRRDRKGIKTFVVEMQKLIPKPDEDYVNRSFDGMTDFELLKVAFENQYNVLLMGHTGSGKTKMVRNFASYMKLPYGRINLDAGYTPDNLLGGWVNVGKEWIWADGILTAFVRHGGVLVLDEINACPPDILFVLNSLLDEDRFIVLRDKDNEIIKANKNLMIVACMNPGYIATKPLNQALLDRFHIVLEVDYDENVESRIITDSRIIRLAKKLRKMYNNGEISKPVSTRSLKMLQDNMLHFSKKLAIEFFVNKFDEEDRELVREIAEQILSQNV